MTGVDTRVYLASHMPDGNPTINDLKALAAALPPDHRIQGAEAADVVSGLAAVVTHGRAILDAAKEGGDAVYAFLHDSIVKSAPEGADEPQRGYVHEATPQPTPGPAQGAIDYDKLAAAIVRAQNHQQTSQPVAATEPAAAPVSSGENITPDAGAATGVASTGDVPAGVHQGEQPPTEEGIL